MKIDILSIAFAFILGSLVGYMAGSPIIHHDSTMHSAPIQDTLPTMGQE